MNKEYTYDAFISYRHTELDKFVAENLHKQLEAFRLPKNVSRKKGDDEKKRIQRIFRDRDELPIASDLAAPIMEALESSEFLIVICSPRVIESMWVKREIETFISMHGRERVLAVLIEGEPSESFPPELLAMEKEFTLEDGTKEIRVVEVEPLAADVRGKDKREILKKIKEEMLRLAAPMFHCGYDDLKQRHREQKIRRTIRIMAEVCVFLLLFGGFTLYQNSQIRSQSEEIKQKSDEIKQQSDEIKQQSDEIKQQSEEIKKKSDEIEKQAQHIQEQYDRILHTSLEQTAEQSLALLEAGDRAGSIRAALSALPHHLNPDNPYIERSEYALAKALYVYQDSGSYVQGDYLLNHDTNVQFMKLSPSGNRVFTLDDTDEGHLWDMKTMKEIKSQGSPLYFWSLDEQQCCLMNDDEIVYYSQGSMYRRNFITGDDIWHIDSVWPISISFSKDLRLFSMSDGKKVTVYDTESGRAVCSYKQEASEENAEGQVITEPRYIGVNMTYSEDASLLALSTEDNQVIVIDTETGALLDRVHTSQRLVKDMIFMSGKMYALSSEGYDIGDYMSGMSNRVFGILCYDIDTREILWSRDTLGSDATDLYITAPESPYIFVEKYSQFDVYDRESSEFLRSITVPSDFVNIVSLQNSDYIRCTCRDGGIYTLNLNTGILVQAEFECNSNNLTQSLQGDGFVLTLPYMSKQIMVSTKHIGNKITKLFGSEYSYDRFILNNACDTVLAIRFADKYSVVDVFKYPSFETMYTIDVGLGISDCCFGGSNETSVVIENSDNIYYFDLTTGKQQKVIDCSDKNISMKYGVTDTETGIRYLIGYEDILSYNLEKGTIIDSFSFDFENNFGSGAMIPYKDRIITACPDRYEVIEEFALAGPNPMSASPLRELRIKTNYISNMFMDDMRTNLFIVYKNNDVDIYSLEDFSYIASYKELGFRPERYAAVGGSGDYILMSDYAACYCSAGHRLKADIGGGFMYDRVNNQMLLRHIDTIFSVPLYNLDMLMEEADRQLLEYK